MNVWWCNQSECWDIERENSVVCSSDYIKRNRQSVEKVKKGEIIVHYRKQHQEIVAFSQAQENGRWGDSFIHGTGWCFKTKYFDLDNPIKKLNFVHSLEPGKYSCYPINKKFGVNQGYFYPFDMDGLCEILKYIDEPKPLPIWLKNILKQNNQLSSITDALSKVSIQLEKESVFDPSEQQDTRKYTLQNIARRQGQPKFRKKLLFHYEERCAITGCDFIGALEAAHIFPHKGEASNKIQNGILLRADIHTLWDLYLIAIDPKTYKVVIHDSLKSTVYKKLNGALVSLPNSKTCWPSKKALLYQVKCLNENGKC